MERESHSIEPIAHLIADARTQPRTDLSLPVALRTARLGKFDGRLINISESGYCAHADMPVDVGAFIVLTTMGFEPLDATVVWIHDDMIGCRFTDHLHPAVVAHLAARAN